MREVRSNFRAKGPNRATVSSTVVSAPDLAARHRGARWVPLTLATFIGLAPEDSGAWIPTDLLNGGDTAIAGSKQPVIETGIKVRAPPGVHAG